MKKGFSLIELLGVIVIMTIIMLIAVPIYGTVRENINQNLYESKIKDVLAKSEQYAEENSKAVFDVRSLITNSYLEPDNERGDYKDPRNDRNMICDIITISFENFQYKASISQSDICHDEEELDSMFGIAKLYLVNDLGEEILPLEDTKWLPNQTVNLAYELKSEYAHYKDYIEEVVWIGEAGKTCTKENLEECNTYNISTTSVKQVEMTLQIKINVNGTIFKSRSSMNINLDTVSPRVLEGSIIKNNDIDTQNKRKVSFELSDGYGSGVAYYKIVKEQTCNGEEYNHNKKKASEGIKTEYLDNGTYFICVEDKVGNKTKDSDLENNKIDVEGVDTSLPTIESIEITSTKNEYHSLNTKVKMVAYDDGDKNKTSELKACLSEEGYLKNCVWEEYIPNETMNFSWKGSYDGTERTLFVVVQDPSGNIARREAKYIVYKECSSKTKVYTEANYGACSKSCGGGIQTRAYQMKDNYTNTVCSSGNDQRTCNNRSCDPVEGMNYNNYESSKKVACDPALFQKLINQYFSKFEAGLNSQNFRYALYDCGNVTGPIIKNSDNAYRVMRNHSRTTIVNGQGRSKQCTCYYNKESKSAEKTCNKPACSGEHEVFMSGNIYNGKIFILSATTSEGVHDWGTSSSKCGEDDGFGECENEGSKWEKWGYRSILLGDNNNQISEDTGWGACTKTTNAIINWSECGAKEERRNRHGVFQNGLYVGLYTYQDWDYDSDSKDRDKNSYSNGRVFVQIFRI